MNHFSLKLQPPPDSFWHPQIEHQHHKSTLPFSYKKYDDGGGGGGGDSDNSSSIANADRSETASTTTTTATTTYSSTVLHKDYMFEKPLTPSDVGKLNRLVIPKQHAEKYFPLAGLTASAAATAGDSASPAGGGVLLGFEDEAGKCWRFRYSYWNSSQSYVLTKGWSRYVKEKKLDAGDVVSFERHRFEPDRFFIGWRKRGSASGRGNQFGWSVSHQQRSSSSSYNYNNTAHTNNSNNYDYNNYNNQNVVQTNQAYAVSHQIPAFAYPTESLHPGIEVRQKARKSGGNSKRVRLFGVNLDCQLDQDDLDHGDDEPQTSDGSSVSSQGQAGSISVMVPTAYNYFDYMGYPPTNHHNHMDVNYPHDVNQMRNRLG